MDINLPLALSARMIENTGEYEWFFTLDDKPVFPDGRPVVLPYYEESQRAFYLVMRQWARTVNPVEEC
jgi:hypothetical protein